MKPEAQREYPYETAATLAYAISLTQKQEILWLRCGDKIDFVHTKIHQLVNSSVSH
jgi:hypothetical protein